MMHWLDFDTYQCGHCGQWNIWPSDWHVWSRESRFRVRDKLPCMKCGKALPASFHSCSRQGKRCLLCGVRVFASERPPIPDSFLRALPT